MDRTKSQDGEGRARIKSETAATRRRHSVKQFEKSKSFGNVNRKKSLASTGNQSIEEERSQEDGKGDDGTFDGKYLKYSTLRYIIVRYLYTIHLYTLTLIHLYKYSFMNSVIKSTVQGLITFILNAAVILSCGHN